MVNTIIKNSLDAIAAKYRGGEMHWLRINNPAALRQLSVLEANVDKAALVALSDPETAVATDYATLRVAARVWQASWLFWVQAIKGKR